MPETTVRTSEYGLVTVLSMFLIVVFRIGLPLLDQLAGRAQSEPGGQLAM
ncbi:hypothetical protein [Streptomyces sp. CA-106131]